MASVSTISLAINPGDTDDSRKVTVKGSMHFDTADGGALNELKRQFCPSLQGL